MRKWIFGVLSNGKLWRTQSVLVALILVGLVLLQTRDTDAQQTPSISPDQLQNLTPDQFQQLQNLSPDQAQRLMSGQQQRSTSQQQGPAQPLVLSPAPLPFKQRHEVSELERIMSGRVGQEIRQFGYDQLGSGSSVAIPQTGAVGDDYVLGPGDQIDVSLRGQENSNILTVVDRNGQVALTKLSPIAAAGRTLGEFRQDLSAAVHRTYNGTDVFVSVDKLRQVSVLVAGEVENPGVRIVTALSSPLDAILLSGGIKKSGSLRNIKLIHDGRQTAIDLYRVLAQQGSSQLVNLRDGDRIFVPAIGATVAAAGSVRRPAIYELPAGRRDIGMRDLMALAAGPTIPGAFTASILRLRSDGRLEFVDVSKSSAALVYDGEALILKAAVNISVGRVTLEGAVRTPGDFALDKYPTLHDLLPSADAIEPGAYVLFGVIDRTDPQSLQRVALPFSPLQIVEGRANLKLLSDDVVHVITRAGMRTLVRKIMAEIKAKTEAPLAPELEERRKRASETAILCKQRSPNVRSEVPSTRAATTLGPSDCDTQPDRESNMDLQDQDANTNPADQATRAARTNQPNPAPNPERDSIQTGNGETTSGSIELGEIDLSGFTNEEGTFFARLLGDYRFRLSGAVREEETYLAAPGTTAAEAVSAAGGFAIDVDLKSFELTSTLIDNRTGISRTQRTRYPASPGQLARIVLRPLDELNFRHVYSDSDGGTVQVAGEVRYPGTYSIMRNEHLSSLMERVGGLTDVAYPYGTVFLRQSAARMEQAGYARATAELRSELFGAFARPATSTASPTPLTPETMVALQSLLTQLQDQPAIGRISVSADPALLAAAPDRDPILEPDDSIIVPKRPSTVAIQGEVRQPGSYPYHPNMTAGDYLAKAGGYTQFALDSDAFIVLPDGSAEQIDSSWMPFNSRGVPPGSVIIVPRDIAPFNWNQFLTTAGQIFSQLAIAGASLAVISENTK